MRQNAYLACLYFQLSDFRLYVPHHQTSWIGNTARNDCSCKPPLLQENITRLALQLCLNYTFYDSICSLHY